MTLVVSYRGVEEQKLEAEWGDPNARTSFNSVRVGSSIPWHDAQNLNDLSSQSGQEKTGGFMLRWLWL